MFLASAALAADPTPTAVLPSAAPAPGGTGEVALTLGHGALLDFLGSSTQLYGVGLRAGWAPTDEVRFELAAGADVRDATSCGLWYGSCSDDSGAEGGLALSARYRIAPTRGFALAPIVGVFAAQGLDTAVGGAVGVAVEGGGDRVRGDLSLMCGVGVMAGVPGVVPAGEGGVSLLVGRERRHALRLGVVEVVPDLSWRYEGKGWMVGAGVTGLPFYAGGERIVGGVLF